MLTLADTPPWLWRLIGTLFGLLWGSFLNVVIYRVPAGLSVVRPASHCPACAAPVKAYDNIPVVSWLALRGRARCCGAKISPRYVLVELMGGALALAIVEVIVLRLPLTTSLGRAAAIYAADLMLALGLVAASFIDLEHLFIPDSISLGGTVLGIATASFRPHLTFLHALIAALAGFFFVWFPFDFLYQRIRGRTGIGMGDAKLVMLAGAWFGAPGAAFALCGGAIQALLFSAGLLLFHGKINESPAVERERARIRAEIEALSPEDRAEGEKELLDDPIFDESQGSLTARMPFGPFLTLAMLEYLFIGNDILLPLLFQS